MCLTVDNGTAVGVDSLATDGAAVVARQEDKASSNLARLRRPADWGGELLDGLVVHGCRNERGPDRSWSNGVDTDSPSDILVRQTASEGDDGALCGRVVEQVWTTDVCIDRGIVDDSCTTLHVREGVLGEEEEGVNVGVESMEPLVPVES